MARATEPLNLRERVQSLRLPDRSGTAGRPVVLPWTLVVLLAIAVVGLNRGGPASPDPSPAPAAKSADPAQVTVVEDVVLEAKGYIIPARQIQVSPIEVAGRVIRINIEEGMRVKAGAVLAELDPTAYEADCREARAQVEAIGHRLRELENGFLPEEREQAEAELKEARENLRQLERDYDRNKRLDNKALSAREFDQTEYAYRAQAMRVNRLEQSLKLILRGPREERIAAVRAELDAARARLERALWRLGNCQILAPVDGTILTKKAEIGGLLSPMSFNVAASLCEMANLAELEVELDVVERDVAKVQPGQPCRIVCEAYPDRTYAGAVVRLMPIANRAKAAVPVRVRIDGVPPEQEGVYLKPEMGARVTFLRPRGANP